MARPKNEDQNNENQEPKASKKSEPKYVAAVLFQDSTKYAKNGTDKKQYKVGTDVSHFDEDRLTELEKRGIVKKA